MMCILYPANMRFGTPTVQLVEFETKKKPAQKGLRENGKPRSEHVAKECQTIMWHSRPRPRVVGVGFIPVPRNKVPRSTTNCFHKGR